MAIEVDQDILQDFLVEAGEILEQLGEQLVELEQRPEDRELLNAVFRGFHTIKGGAGFLNLTPLVDLCHRAEDVFNVLRQGERSVDAALMDTVLQSLDLLNGMFDAVRSGEAPEPADAELLERLVGYTAPADSAVAAEPAAEPVPAPTKDAVEEEFEALLADLESAGAAPAEPDSEEITDAEFEALLDNLHGSGKAPGAAAAGDDQIGDDEFEALLDELHGAGKAPGAQAAAAGDEINDDEFEALLDQLHGTGKAPGAAAGKPAAAAAPAKAPAPAPVKQAPPASAPAKETSAAADAKSPAKAPAAPVAETTVRVDTKRLDHIMNLVGELVLVRNRLSALKSNLADDQVAKAVANLDLVTSDLQAAVMKTRMQPIKKVFGRFPRVVRDLARSLRKEIELELRGEETDLDKNLVEALADPLVHLVRNSVDHGIEMPADRVAAGKPRTGRVVLSADQEGDQILLTISDDGKGLNKEVLRRKAVEKGLMDEEVAGRLSDAEVYNIIFMPGFSTKSEISDISGRGVGMDVVKTRISQLNGSIEIDSELGVGTTIRIKVPLTLAILPTLMVVVGDQRFALPLNSVSEAFNLERQRVRVVDGQEVVLVRNKAMPIFHLHRWLVRGGAAPAAEPQVVVVHLGSQRVGFVVDGLLGQEEVVIKPLGAMLHGVPGLAGATITGDGRIALILDVPGLVQAYGRRG